MELIMMCFILLRYGIRWYKKLDCTYNPPKDVQTALTTGRCNRKICCYYHKTGTIRPIPHKPTSGQTRSTIPIMELNLPPYQNNKRHPYPSLINHKASPPHTTTSQSHHQTSTTATDQSYPLGSSHCHTESLAPVIPIQ